MKIKETLVEIRKRLAELQETTYKELVSERERNDYLTRKHYDVCNELNLKEKENIYLHMILDVYERKLGMGDEYTTDKVMINGKPYRVTSICTSTYPDSPNDATFNLEEVRDV